MKTAPDSVFQCFLEKQLAEGQALAASSSLLHLQPLAGSPPFQYIAQFGCKGLARNSAGEVLEHDLWILGIQFPPEYLRSRIHPSQILMFLGTGERSGLTAWHPNIRDCFICLEITPGMPLTEILFGLFDLLTWRLYSTKDEGLNQAASQFARGQAS